MGLIVQKFGGSSVKSIERIRAVAKRILQEVRAGNQLVVVVSAMGKSTDHLLGMAKKITPHPDPREMDQLLATGEQVSTALLCMALHQLDIKAISLTGWQAGIMTEKVHSQARIVEVKKEKIVSHIEKGRVVIVAGFQGVTEDGEVTTIGRGGSDTSAVVLAAALGAERCDIFTDVDGVYTADPRIVPNARLLRHISSNEMLALAQLGAQVLHPRAVACAMTHDVPLTVRSSYHEAEGTRIGATCSSDEKLPVYGIVWIDNLVKVTLAKGNKKAILSTHRTNILTQSSLIYDDLMQQNSQETSFFIEKEDLENIFGLFDQWRQAIKSISYERYWTKISVVGHRINNPNIVAMIQKHLNDASIEQNMVITSKHSVSCFIPQEALVTAANTLHQAFRLDRVHEAVLSKHSLSNVKNINMHDL